MKMIVWSVICYDVLTLNVATHKRHVDIVSTVDLFASYSPPHLASIDSAEQPTH